MRVNLKYLQKKMNSDFVEGDNPQKRLAENQAKQAYQLSQNTNGRSRHQTLETIPESKREAKRTII